MSQGGPLAVEVQDLEKRYEGAGVQALAGVTFDVEEGEIFGYLGRNGAGKSTTVRILTTLLRSTAGRALVGGFDVATHPAAVRQIIGVALQEAALDELMTGREHLVLAARLTGLGKGSARLRADELLEIFDLRAAADHIAARYSGGMRRRLDVAMAVVRRPRVLFLDEPTTGLDPQGRQALWAVVRSLRDEGSTVFLTTHNLAEADELATRVAIVHEGRIAAIGTPSQLKVRHGASIVRVRTDGANATRLLEIVSERAGSRSDDGWHAVTVDGGEAATSSLVARLAAAGASIDRITVHTPTLEDVFVTLTGTQMESSVGSDGMASLAAVRRSTARTTGNRR